MISYHFANYGFIQHERMENLPLYLIDTGIERRDSPSYYFDNSNRSSFQGYLIQYTLKGTGVFVKNGTKYLLEEGCCFFTKIPENSHYYFEPGLCTEWDYFYLHFDGPTAEPFYRTITELTNGFFSISYDSTPIHLFFRLIESYTRKGYLDLYESGEFLYRFLSGILRELENPTDTDSSPVLTASHYMRKHFSTIDSITEVSDACNISPEHFCRLFQKEKGQSPLQFLTKLRIEHALFLLLNTSDDVEKIATACCYQNGNYFAKVFKKYLLCTPSEYRRRN